ncbi:MULTISPECIES: hypothetical protein [unclassified Isoptericola]|uniref:hypothetical protein n=1 Tax=unclassified Isoptericola TaxID=2623355 RepID=UPI00364FA4CD
MQDGYRAAPAGSQVGAGDEAPTTAALALRPLGYFCLAWVWVVIWLVTVLIAPGAVVYVYFDDEIILGQVLSDTSVVGLVMLVVVLVPILAAIMGPAAMFYLPTMTWPLAALCFVYAFRALRPSYAAERLSHSTSAPRGTTLGPPTVGTVALSLKPNRRSRATDVLMKWYMAGWSLQMPTFVGALPAGVGWVLMFVWASRDIAPPVRTACLVGAVALVLVSVVLVARALRADFRRWGAEGDPEPVPTTSAARPLG